MSAIFVSESRRSLRKLKFSDIEYENQGELMNDYIQDDVIDLPEAPATPKPVLSLPSSRDNFASGKKGTSAKLSWRDPVKMDSLERRAGVKLKMEEEDVEDKDEAYRDYEDIIRRRRRKRRKRESDMRHEDEGESDERGQQQKQRCNADITTLTVGCSTADRMEFQSDCVDEDFDTGISLTYIL